MNDRPNTALLVIDMQTDVVTTAFERDRVAGNITSLVNQARVEDTPVIWVQHDDDDLVADSEGWQIIPELQPANDEPIIRKNFRNAFDDTPLEDTLASLDVGRLIVTGAQTDFCVRWTLHGALERGYDTVLAADAHTTDAESPPEMAQGAQIIAHANSTWASQATTNGSAAVVDTADIAF